MLQFIIDIYTYHPSLTMDSSTQGKLKLHTLITIICKCNPVFLGVVVFSSCLSLHEMKILLVTFDYDIEMELLTAYPHVTVDS